MPYSDFLASNFGTTKEVPLGSLVIAADKFFRQEQLDIENSFNPDAMSQPTTALDHATKRLDFRYEAKTRRELVKKTRVDTMICTPSAKSRNGVFTRQSDLPQYRLLGAKIPEANMNQTSIPSSSTGAGSVQNEDRYLLAFEPEAQEYDGYATNTLRLDGMSQDEYHATMSRYTRKAKFIGTEAVPTYVPEEGTELPPFEPLNEFYDTVLGVQEQEEEEDSWGSMQDGYSKDA